MPLHKRCKSAKKNRTSAELRSKKLKGLPV
jgi:hypothetical protein